MHMQHCMLKNLFILLINLYHSKQIKLKHKHKNVYLIIYTKYLYIYILIFVYYEKGCNDYSINRLVIYYSSAKIRKDLLHYESCMHNLLLSEIVQ